LRFSAASFSRAVSPSTSTSALQFAEKTPVWFCFDWFCFDRFCFDRFCFERARLQAAP
jgi:hypothetical protein